MLVIFYLDFGKIHSIRNIGFALVENPKVSNSLNVKILAKDLKTNFQDFLSLESSKQNKKLKLGIVLIGNDLASEKYIQIKSQIGAQISVDVQLHKIGINEDFQTAKKSILDLIKNSDGIIYQLPIPDKFKELLELIPVSKDVDLLTPESIRLWDKDILPPTIKAIDLYIKYILDYPIDNLSKNKITSKGNQDALLESFDISKLVNFRAGYLKSKVVAVIGQGVLVGSPLLKYLQLAQASIISINKDTKNPHKLTQFADIIISAAGSKNLIDECWIAKNKKVILIDAATSESDNALVGDLNYSKLNPESIIVPSPGGIGKLTVLCLFWNLIRLNNIKNT